MRAPTQIQQGTPQSEGVRIANDVSPGNLEFQPVLALARLGRIFLAMPLCSNLSGSSRNAAPATKFRLTLRQFASGDRLFKVKPIRRKSVCERSVHVARNCQRSDLPDKAETGTLSNR